MITNALDLLKENQDCLEILRAYAVRENHTDGEPDSKWTKRIFGSQEQAVDSQQENEKSSEAHGLLIAYGYLDIELAGRGDGIHYRLSSDGVNALKILSQQEAA